MAADLVPEVALGLHLVPGGLEQGTTQLLDLIHQEGQHHQKGQHHRQVLLAMSVVVFQVIAWLFKVFKASFSIFQRARPLRIMARTNPRELSDRELLERPWILPPEIPLLSVHYEFDDSSDRSVSPLRRGNRSRSDGRACTRPLYSDSAGIKLRMLNERIDVPHTHGLASTRPMA